MESSVIQKTIVALVLVVLAFIAGSMAAESRTDSLFFVGGVAALAFVIMLGRRCWWLIFLAPPLLSLVPLGVVRRMPVGFAVGGAVMIYWVVLTLIGAVRMRWRSLAAMDLIVVAVLVYFVCSYVRHPVIMGYFAGFDDQEVGGQEYLWCICACVYYASLSLIPCSRPELERVLRCSLILVVLMSIMSTMKGMSDTSAVEIAQNAVSTRFGLFVGIGTVMVMLIVCRYRIIETLFSPLKLGVLLVAFVLIILGGTRGALLSLVCTVGVVAFIRREVIVLSVLAALSYGSVLLMSSTGTIKELPFGIQRSLSIIPGVEVERAVEREVSHSSSWRVVMWKWALDPRTGYIRDYVWGDGFSVDMDAVARSKRAQYRGESDDPQLHKRFARTGTWHSGPITVIHRLGIVGLVMLVLLMLCGLVVICRACGAFQGQKIQFYYLYFLAPLGGSVAHFCLSAGTIGGVFGMMTYFALGKVVYCMARDEGLLKPLFSRKEYVPLVQRVPAGAQPMLVQAKGPQESSWDASDAGRDGM